MLLVINPSVDKFLACGKWEILRPTLWKKFGCGATFVLVHFLHVDLLDEMPSLFLLIWLPFLWTRVLSSRILRFYRRTSSVGSHGQCTCSSALSISSSAESSPSTPPLAMYTLTFWEQACVECTIVLAICIVVWLSDNTGWHVEKSNYKIRRRPCPTNTASA